MSCCLPRVASLFVALGCVSAVAAADPPGEVLPPPRPALPAPAEAYSPLMRTVAPAYAFYSYPRRSAYDVWKYYDVDRFGYFRPRVIYSSQGAYYLYNGKPFPWATVNPLEFMP